MVSASSEDDKIAWYENDGNQNFTTHNITTNADKATAVLTKDMDGDGDVDVLSASINDDKIAWYENDGNQSFTTHVITTSANGARSVYAGDLDGDGDVDVLSASYHDDKIAWYENDGNQSFATHIITTNADRASSVFAKDIDSDGDIDVVSSSEFDNKVAWYENDGNQSFLTHIITTNAIGALDVFAADIDSDGDVDILTATDAASYQGNDQIDIYSNDGNQNFIRQTVVKSYNQYRSVMASDIDNDGDLDFITTAYLGDDIDLYENKLINTISESACDSYTSPSGNQIWNTSGIYFDTITNCPTCIDSIIKVDLTIYYSSYNSVDTITACDNYTWIDGNSYNSTNNTATHTLSSVYGCDSLVSLDLTINSSSTGITTQTACISYTWIDGNTYTSSTNTPTYTLTNAAGCDSVVTLNLTVNTVNNSVSNSIPTLTADATGATYQWLDCNNNYAPIPGETNQSFTANANGSYAVEVTQNGCVDTSACEQVNNVGINEINSNITLHPNPTTGIVELQGINGSFKVDVYDYVGKFLLSTNRSTIDLSDYPSGIYFFKVAYGDKTESLG